MTLHLTSISYKSVIFCSCWLAMLLQYGPNDLNGDNPHFSEQAHQRWYEYDYPEGAHQSD